MVAWIRNGTSQPPTAASNTYGRFREARVVAARLAAFCRLGRRARRRGRIGLTVTTVREFSPLDLMLDCVYTRAIYGQKLVVRDEA